MSKNVLLSLLLLIGLQSTHAPAMDYLPSKGWLIAGAAAAIFVPYMLCRSKENKTPKVNLADLETRLIQLHTNVLVCDEFASHVQYKNNIENSTLEDYARLQKDEITKTTLNEILEYTQLLSGAVEKLRDGKMLSADQENAIYKKKTCPPEYLDFLLNMSYNQVALYQKHTADLLKNTEDSALYGEIMTQKEEYNKMSKEMDKNNDAGIQYGISYNKAAFKIAKQNVNDFKTNDPFWWKKSKVITKNGKWVEYINKKTSE